MPSERFKGDRGIGVGERGGKSGGTVLKVVVATRRRFGELEDKGVSRRVSSTPRRALCVQGKGILIRVRKSDGSLGYRGK